MFKKLSNAQVTSILLLIAGVLISLISWSAEHGEWLRSLSISMVAGLRGVQLPSNFVACLSYSDTASTLGFGQSTPHEALFGNLCHFAPGLLKVLPALAYAVIKGFTAGFWGVAFDLLLCLFCIEIVRDLLRGKQGFVESLWQVILAVALLWLLTYVLIWVFTALNWLLGVIGTYATAILGAAKVWDTYKAGREIRVAAAEVKSAARVVPGAASTAAEEGASDLTPGP